MEKSRGKKIQANNKDQLTKILYCKVGISHLEKKSFRCHEVRRLRTNANSDGLLSWLRIATTSVIIEGTR